MPRFVRHPRIMKMMYPGPSSIRMSIVSGHPPQTRSFRSSGLHSLAFRLRNFCLSAKDQASSPHDGLLRDIPTPCSHDISGLNILPFTFHEVHPLTPNAFRLTGCLDHLYRSVGDKQDIRRPATVLIVKVLDHVFQVFMPEEVFLFTEPAFVCVVHVL
jgi:hypothetical protein